MFLRRDAGFSVKRLGNSAYPRVISNMGSLTDEPETQVAINMIRFMNHYARTITERKKIIDFFRTDAYTVPMHRPLESAVMIHLPLECKAFANRGGKMGTKEFMCMMYDQFATGYANTVGYAHPNTGDTMTSVMIGGLRTVMNGDFEVFAGDLVQFYWCFEKDDFTPDGRRKPYFDIWNDDSVGGYPNNVDPSITERGTTSGVKRDSQGRETWGMLPDARIRQANYNLSYGQRADKMKIVAKIKPYIPDEENPRLNDWFRVFGTAIASARPNEMCDIKISRQSM
jgi:hypothetical protein